MLDGFETDAGLRSPHGRVLARPAGARGQVLEISGKKWPNFFVFFGAFFGGFPLLIWLGQVGKLLSGDFNELLPIFFLLPFILIGGGVFISGLFVMIGHTLIEIDEREVRVIRRLLKLQRTVAFQRDHNAKALMDVSHHEGNTNCSVEISGFRGAKAVSTSVGSTLKDDDLVWLHERVCQYLGVDAGSGDTPEEVATAQHLEAMDDVEGVVACKFATMQIGTFPGGWEIRQKPGWQMWLLVPFGGVFAGVGWSLFFSGGGQWESGGPAPIWFSLIFALVGSVVILAALILVSYRCRITAKHGELVVHKTFLGRGRELVVRKGETFRIEIMKNGHSNGSPRYSLELIFADGTKKKVVHWRAIEEVHRIKAALETW